MNPGGPHWRPRPYAPAAWIVLGGAALALAGPAAHAEQLFVADKLVLNVYADADQASARIATIQTGDVVEGLERFAGFVHVQLANGREGWVGENYLTAQAPAAVRLAELQQQQESAADAARAAGAEQKRLKSEIADLKKQNDTLRGELDDLKEKAQEQAEAREQAREQTGAAAASGAQQQDAEAEQAAEAEQSGQVDGTAGAPAAGAFAWAWLAAAVAAGGGGFLAGYYTLARRIREKFGGLKIY